MSPKLRLIFRYTVPLRVLIAYMICRYRNTAVSMAANQTCFEIEANHGWLFVISPTSSGRLLVCQTGAEVSLLLLCLQLLAFTWPKFWASHTSLPKLAEICTTLSPGCAQETGAVCRVKSANGSTKCAVIDDVASYPAGAPTPEAILPEFWGRCCQPRGCSQ